MHLMQFFAKKDVRISFRRLRVFISNFYRRLCHLRLYDIHDRFDLPQDTSVASGQVAFLQFLRTDMFQELYSLGRIVSQKHSLRVREPRRISLPHKRSIVPNSRICRYAGKLVSQRTCFDSDDISSRYHRNKIIQKLLDNRRDVTSLPARRLFGHNIPAYAEFVRQCGMECAVKGFYRRKRNIAAIA